MGGRPAAAIAAALWLGILGGRGLPEPGAWAALGLAGLAALASLRTPRLVAAALLVVAAFALGAFRGALHHRGFVAARETVHAGEVYRLHAIVDGPSGLAAERALVVLRIERASPLLAAGTRARVRLPEGAAAEWGDRVECLAELAPPTARRNPGGWDGLIGAEATGLAAHGRAFTWRKIGRSPAGALLQPTFVRWRRALESRLLAGLSPTARDLVVPLVTGDRAALPTELDADFRAAGLVHLIALSGLHLSALAAVARVLAATLGGGLATRALGGALAAILYVGLAGPIPSLMRAAVGELWLSASRIGRRAADPLQALAVTAIVLLAAQPGWALDLGFQLSCAASLGLATLAPLQRVAPARGGRWRELARAAGLTLAATVAAQLLCAPALLARVHGLSWPALIANLAAVPTCGLLLAAAWLAAVADALASGAGHFCFSACELLARLLIAETSFAARWPSALIACGHSRGVVLLAAAGAALLAIAACAPHDLESRARRWTPAREAMAGLGGFAAALALAIAATSPALRPPPGKAWLVVLDVGQGDAIALAMGDEWWLIDAGPRSPQYDAGDRVVRPFFRWAAVRRLAVLALTHDDGDHTGGAAAVRKGVAVERLAGPRALPGVPGPLARFGGGTPAWPLAAGDTLRRVPCIVVRWPPRDAARLTGPGDNAASLVLEIAIDSTRVLLTADVDSTVENVLVAPAPVALLKAGHHGSKSSTGETFLARIRPAVAAISAGERNVYGHPAPEVLERFARAGTRVDRTDREGALWYELSKQGVVRMDWRAEAFVRAPLVREGARHASSVRAARFE